jgi:hypothetical protein
MREEKERVNQENLHLQHVMIRSELRYLVGAKGVGTVKLYHGVGTTQLKNCRVMSSPGNNPAKTTPFRCLAGSGTELN